MDFIELKNDAKEKLQNIWAEAIKIILLMLLVSFGVGLIFGLTSYFLDINTETISYKIVNEIISILISSLLSFGYLSFFIKVSRNEQVNCMELFSKTNMFITYIIMTLLIDIIVALGFLLLIIPGIIMAFSLTQTSYILLDNKDLSVIDAMKLSYNMMKGHKWDCFLLCISFLGWAILGIFTLGILYLWLIPYISVTMANFYNKIKEEYEQKI